MEPISSSSPIVTSTTDDIGQLVGDSFSDFNSDDSSSWMQGIDVSNFRQLTYQPHHHPDFMVSSQSVIDHAGYTTPQTSIISPCESIPSVPAPNKKRERTSAGSVDSTHDYAAETQPIIEGTVSTSCKTWPKPIYSYSCLIALALKNSSTGRLTVAEIYNFMCENFPYFRNAPAGWKNSVRHNLSLNKCFEKIELDTPGGHGRKSCLWMINPNKVNKMDSEIKKWREKDPQGVLESLKKPEDLEIIEKGMKGMPGEFNYFVHSLPEVHATASGQQQLLIVRPNPAGYLSSYQLGSLQQNREPVPRLRSVPPPLETYGEPPRTPPRQSTHSQLPCSPQLKQLQSPSTYSTPLAMHRVNSAPVTQSSPFTHTPPYSPNVHSPHFKPTDWTGTSTPQQAYSPFSIQKLTAPPVSHNSPGPPPFSPGHYLQSHTESLLAPRHQFYSPCGKGAAAGPLGAGFGSYETASNALNNNSLLQTALADSPCRNANTVLQNL